MYKKNLVNASKAFFFLEVVSEWAWSACRAPMRYHYLHSTQVMWVVAISCQQFSCLSWKDDQKISTRNIWYWVQPNHSSLHAVWLLSVLSLSHSDDDDDVAICRNKCNDFWKKGCLTSDTSDTVGAVNLVLNALWQRSQLQILWTEQKFILIRSVSGRSLVAVISVGTKILWFAFRSLFF